MDRRQFVKNGTVAAAGLMFVKPGTAFGSAANSALQIGMIGPGGRGSSVAEDFVRSTNTRVTALADVFDDQLAAAVKLFDGKATSMGQAAALTPNRLFKGPTAYQDLCKTDVDIILVSTPPWFHPEHVSAAVASGKHVYCEKPVATDVYGCKQVQATSRKVTNRQMVHVGFQIRYSPPYKEMTRRIHEGALGGVVCAHGYYFAGDLPRHAKPGMSPTEAKIRDWFFDKALSGDVLVEQNIHILDWINWTLKARPERVEASAGRKVRTDIGDVNDHFVTTYFYPNDVRVSFASTQFLPKWGDVAVRFFGPKGMAEAHYNGNIFIVGAPESEWRATAAAPSGEVRPEVDPLGPATSEKAKAFVDGVLAGRFENQLDQGAESTLTAIMGRTAAYTGREQTWDQFMKSDHRWPVKINWNDLK